MLRLGFHRIGLLLACAALGFSAPAQDAPKLILISWDGAGDVVIDRLLDEGRLPNLAKLLERGSGADHLVGTLPSKTAPSHASIYTGCGPAVHGIMGNRVLYYDDPSAHTVLESRRGFSASALTAEPLFVTTALSGLSTAVLGATHYVPHAELDRALEQADYLSFSGFEGERFRSAVIGPSALGPEASAEAVGWSELPAHRGAVRELDLGVPGLHGLIFDAASDDTEGFDRLLIRQGSKHGSATREATLAPREATATASAWSPLLSTEDGADGSGQLAPTAFRLFELSADGSSLALYRRRLATVAGHHGEAQRTAFLSVDSGVHDVPFPAYAWGRFGKQLYRGGDGEAERRLLETVAFDIDLRIAGVREIWRTAEPQALFLYSPISDQAGHAWIGALDPGDDASAERLWPFYAGVFEHLDRWLAAIVELAASHTVIALVSDHGMAPATRLVNIQRALAEAGLVAFDDAGQVELARTRILAAESDFFLRINSDRWRGGVVPEAERAATIELAADALLAIRDPATGRRPIRRLFTREDVTDLAADGEHGGDLHLDFAPGYYPTRRDSRRHPEAVVYASPFPIGQGGHGFWPGRRDMHAIFYLAGPGVARGSLAPAARQIDVAPTLSKLLGIRPPKDACGRILAEVLEQP